MCEKSAPLQFVFALLLGMHNDKSLINTRFNNIH